MLTLHRDNREVSLYPCIQKPEVDPVLVPYNNSYMTLKLVCYCVNPNDNVTTVQLDLNFMNTHVCNSARTTQI